MLRGGSSSTSRALRQSRTSRRQMARARRQIAESGEYHEGQRVCVHEHVTADLLTPYAISVPDTLHHDTLCQYRTPCIAIRYRSTGKRVLRYAISVPGTPHHDVLSESHTLRRKIGDMTVAGTEFWYSHLKSSDEFGGEAVEFWIRYSTWS
eukprot:184367-Rhodomonas_salina.2